MDWLVTMWSDKPVWWFLQWPVIGHGHAHVGQASAVRAALGLQPVRAPTSTSDATAGRP